MKTTDKLSKYIFDATKSYVMVTNNYVTLKVIMTHSTMCKHTDMVECVPCNI